MKFIGFTNKSIFKIISYSAYAFFSFLLLMITLQYMPYHTDVAFLRIKQQYIHIDHWRIAFFLHVYSSIFLLGAGFTQFSTWFRLKYRNWHKWIGIVYITTILFISGPSALIMAFYANGYLSSRIAFTILASMWIFFTFQAWKYICERNFRSHEYFMIRSFALTTSAITLRIWKWLIVLLFHPNPMDVYMIVAWLGFIPNLIIAELIIRSKKRRVSN